MNTVYLKTEKSQRKVKTFNIGSLQQAMDYGWKLANKNKVDYYYFIITEGNKCLKFNTTIVL
jgi:hypothetical protein